jgi:hypothetical protein
MKAQNKVEFFPKSPALKTVVDVIDSNSIPTEIIKSISSVGIQNFSQSEQSYIEKMSLQFALGYKNAVSVSDVEANFGLGQSNFIDDIDSKMEKLVIQMI